MDSSFDVSRYRLRPLHLAAQPGAAASSVLEPSNPDSGVDSAAFLYRAVPEDPGQRPAILRFFPPDPDSGKLSAQRVDTEIELLHTLNHRAIPRLLGTGLHGSRFYCVFAPVAGTSLGELLQRSRIQKGLPVAHARTLLLSLLEALDYLHQQTPPLVHGDISPNNLLVDDQFHVYLFNFTSTQPLCPNGTVEQYWVGDPAYLSPEQARGQPWSTASDIFQAGRLFYQLLSGVNAVADGDARRQRSQCATPAPLDLDHVPHALHKFIEHMLQTEPRQRFESARACIQALRQILVVPNLEDWVAESVAPQQEK